MTMKPEKRLRQPPDPAVLAVFAARLTARLDALGKSAEWLAGELNVSAASAYAWKSGRTLPGLDVADRVARAVGVPLDYLTGRRDDL